ncbi:MAG: hypothetical protein JO227_04395 [Acetobacteraceae bacterium]|nr:hypothetical protein [Acetobacteraceae bacterium]
MDTKSDSRGAVKKIVERLGWALGVILLAGVILPPIVNLLASTCSI